MKLMFLGAPGAGKGTQAEYAAERLGIPQISTGVILRAAIKEGSELGTRAKGYMDRGELVPDDIVIGLLKERISMSDCSGGFILDGFPRTLQQARFLDSEGIALDLVVNIKVEDEAILRRLGGRRSCPGCGASYHVIYKSPKIDGVCDVCGEGLIIRSDDNIEAITARLEAYRRQTEPLIKYYGGKGILQTVIGQEEVSDTTRLTTEVINKLKSK